MSSLTGKKILLLCKETYSYPLYFLAKKWVLNNDVAAFFFMPLECKLKKSQLNDTTYYAFKNIDGITVFDSIDIANEFEANHKKPIVDYDYLKEVENKYTKFKNLYLQIMSSQFLTRQYHFRNYYKIFTRDQLLYWLQLNYKLCEKIISEYNPDIIIDTDTAELPRTIIAEIADRNKIPYISIEYSRFEKYITPTFKCGYGIDDYFKDAFASNIKKDNSVEQAYINNYCKKEKIMPSIYEGTQTAKYKSDSYYVIFKRLYGYLMYFIEQDFKGGGRKLKRNNKLIYNSSYEYMKYFYRVEMVRKKLLRKNKYFEEPVKDEKYYYMPLHLIPESTTFVKAPIYVDELQIIKAVSKSLPVDCFLYVKEHQSMIGERSISFYKEVKKLPNVKLVQLNYYNDPKPWIKNSLGVITIAGTTAFEAALLGKKAFVFSDMPYTLIDSITRVRSFEDLEHLLSHNNDDNNNTASLCAYMKTVKDVGVEVNVNYLANNGCEIIRSGSKPDDKYIEELNKLEAFFEKSYDIYFNYNKK